MPITTGTKTELILSASLDIGALDELASSTNCTILESDVSFPTWLALNSKLPSKFIVADKTLS